MRKPHPTSLSILLALCVLLTASLGTFARDTATIDVLLNVQPYATITVDRSPLDFGTLSGEAGIYHMNGNMFLNELRKAWGGGAAEFRLHGGDQDGRTQLSVLTVRANADVDVTFEFIEGSNWISAPTLFGVWVDAQGSYKGRYFGTATGYNLSTKAQQGLGVTEYVVVGGVFIEEVHFVEAGNYSAEILVTVGY